MEKIVIEHVTKYIRKNCVLDDVSMELEAGKIYGFVGVNGSGKTMLFRAISGLIRPTEGSIYVFGKRIGEDVSFPEDLGLMIENVGFWPEYTGKKNLELLASIRKKIGEKEIEEAMERVGLNPKDQRTYKKYSLGMKQRLGIAQAVMEKPQLLILDEPTNALDEDGVELIRKVIREENERGATVLIATHNKEDAQELCEACYRMSEGKAKKLEVEGK